MAAVERRTRDEIATEIADLKEDLDKLEAEWEGKKFDDVARSEYNRINEDIDDLEELDKELLKREERRKALAGKEENVERVEVPQVRRAGAVSGEDIWDLDRIQRSWDNPELEEQQLRDRALRAIERSRFPHPRADHEDTQGHLESMVGDAEGGDRKGADVARHMLITGSPAYRSAFTKYLSGAPLSEKDHRTLYRSMSLTAASGGYAVPYVLDPTLIPTSDGAINPYRAIASVATITVDEWRGVTHGGNPAAFQAEEAEVADDSLTLAQPTVSTEMARWFVPYSIEIGQDWGSFASEMASVVQDEKDILEATKFAVGSGTNEPAGVITGTSASVYTASDSDSLIVADIYGVHNALPVRFRSRASFTMRNEIADKIRQFDTAGGAQLWVQNLQLRSAAGTASFTDGRMGADLFGKAVYEATGQSGALTTGQLVAAFGDFSYYKIVDRVGLTIERIDHMFATGNNRPSGQRGLFAYWRVGAKVLSASAFRLLKMA